MQFIRVFQPKSGLKSINLKFRFLEFMRTVPRNIPMKFHRSNLKTEEGVCKSLNPDRVQTEYRRRTIYIAKYPTSFVGGYKKCKKWLDRLTQVNFPLNTEELLFHIRNESSDKTIDLYNRFFFLARVFLWRCRCEKSTPTLINFLVFLYDEILYDMCILQSKSKSFETALNDRWALLVEESNVLNREY